MNPTLKLAGALAALLVTGPACAGTNGDADIRHGRYLIATSGCNDCHTPGYMVKDGQVPESEWLTGDAMSWQGPWGTTYASNLRRVVHGMSEAQWLAHARAPMRPPMPSASLRAMSDADLRAIYRYVKSLPVKGDPAPAYVPPGGVVKTPYFDFTPKNLPPTAAK